MKNLSFSRKIGIFYDGNYWTTVSNYYNFIHPFKARLNVAGLHNLIADEVSDFFQIEPNECFVSEVHFFKSRYSAQEAKDRGNQLYYDRVVDDILMYGGVTPHYIPVRGGNVRNGEKELVVSLTSTVIDSAIRHGLDFVVLIGADSSYIPLIKTLKSIGVSVVLVSWSFDSKPDEPNYRVGITSNDLIKEAVHYMPMEEIIEEGLKAKDAVVEAVIITRGSANDPEEDMVTIHETDDEDHEIYTGIVHNLKAGFGFIRHPNNNLFFHYLDVIGNFTDLREGDKVEYTLGKNKEGNDVAKNVRKIETV